MKQHQVSRIRVYLAVLLAVVLATAGGTAYATATTEPASHEFDFDEGNAIVDVFVPASEHVIAEAVNPTDAPLVLHLTVLLSNAWFDATAPYHPTAVGVSADLGRRPAEASATNKDPNIAILHATYQILNGVLPEHSEHWREMLTSVGLDPDDQQQSLDNPVGIGNRAGAEVLADRERDGLNLLGDEGGSTYHQQRYADYTGYEPVNTAYELSDPSRWQPAVVTDGDGIFRVQQFITPQLGITTPYSYDNPNRFRVRPPRQSNHPWHPAYQRQADEVLAASAELTEEQKMIAELNDNKFLGLGLSTAVTALNNGLSLIDFVQYHFLLDVASFDAAIAIWSEKRRHDAVRPFSAISYLYGDEPVTAWGGPGQGTVDDLPASEWRSYLNTADHPEYPSGSAGLCAAHAQAARSYFETDEMEFGFTFPQGSSNIEPGVTPSSDMVLSWTNWTDFARDCGLSRLWAGVHFMPAVETGWRVGERVGDQAHEFVQKHIAGDVG